MFEKDLDWSCLLGWFMPLDQVSTMPESKRPGKERPGGMLIECKNQNSPEEEEGIGPFSIDDFAFIFVQVQHNIHKWIFVYQAFQEK
jgi:hypothetical protein